MPQANAPEAALVEGIDVYPVETPARLATRFRDYHPIEPYWTVFEESKSRNPLSPRKRVSACGAQVWRFGANANDMARATIAQRRRDWGCVCH